MKNVLSVCVAALLGCWNEPDSKRTLEAMGYTDIQFAPVWLTCGDGSPWQTPFEANNAQGARVRGVVCCGFVAGCMVRF